MQQYEDACFLILRTTLCLSIDNNNLFISSIGLQFLLLISLSQLWMTFPHLNTLLNKICELVTTNATLVILNLGLLQATGTIAITPLWNVIIFTSLVLTCGKPIFW